MEIPESQVRAVAKSLSRESLARMIDLTLLSSTASEADVRQLCEQAKTLGTNICVAPARLDVVRTYKLDGRIAAVVGFPFGNATTKAKVYEAEQALLAGAQEIDMVAHPALLCENPDEYARDIGAVLEAVSQVPKSTLKVIIETCYLDSAQIKNATVRIANLAQRYDAHIFVKTSTGYGMPAHGIPKGATLENVALIAGTIQAGKYRVGVKASGGIGDAETAIKVMIAAGVEPPYETAHTRFRIGASKGAEILSGFEKLK